MPRRDESHGGGAGWRFAWRADRLQKLHELGHAFGLTDDSRPPEPPRDRHVPEPAEPTTKRDGDSETGFDPAPRGW